MSNPFRNEPFLSVDFKHPEDDRRHVSLSMVAKDARALRAVLASTNGNLLLPIYRALSTQFRGRLIHADRMTIGHPIIDLSRYEVDHNVF